MRTKLLIGAVVLAASLASSMAQNVYSLNVVGYVNVTMPHGKYTCVANPLDATLGGTVTGGNDITNLFQNVPTASFINVWAPSQNDYSTTLAPTWQSRTSKWSANFTMAPGMGIMFYVGPSADYPVTFTGQVQQGPYTVATLGYHQFSMVGSPVPIGGDITNSTTVVGLAPGGADGVQTWNPTANDWATLVTWGTRSSKWTGPMPVAAAQGFFYYNANAANTWSSNFTVQ